MLGQLDMRNGIAMRMHATVEAREDTYPDISALSKLVTGLGDSGGGWVTP